MSRSTARTVPAKDSSQEFNKEKQTDLPASSLRNHAAAGLAAALLLSVVELVDLNIQLTPVFYSFTERLTLAAYISLNLVVGSMIGLIVGAAAVTGSYFKKRLERVMRGGGEGKVWQAVAAGLIVSAAAAVLFYFIPEVHRYALGVIREAEKIPRLTYRMLNYEWLFVYLVIAGYLIAFWALWSLARATGSMRPALRLAWLSSIILVIAAAYYVDSRIEVQLYEPSLHRTMFVVEFALALALVASLHSSHPRISHLWNSRSSSLKPIASLSSFAIIAACLLFTFACFDHNQNLKTQVFFRSTQLKQHFLLARWALDFDRDSYSRLLGGGDSDDTNASVNPAQLEVASDGLDNNSIGGEMTQQQVDEWMTEHQALNGSASTAAGGAEAAATRHNVIFIFVDTVRADHLSVYGYGRDTTPNLKRFAEARASVFDNAFTPSPSTYQAVPKFMQSSLWDAHVETWTELLARNGYETVLFPGRRASTLYRRIKDPQMINSSRTNNLKETVDGVIEKFTNSEADKPFCAYVYAFEPHMPYRQRHDFDFGPALADLYDGELAYVDHHLGRLFDWLERSGKINNTMVVLMSDHGESLGERAVYKHNSQLYNEQMRVPMIISVPGLNARRISDYVSTIDLGSTILNAVGISCPKEYVGTSLLPIMRGEPFVHPPVYGEHWQRNDSPFWGPEKNVDPEIHKFMVITQDGFKLIYSRNYFTFELYDLKSDPKEKHNLFDRMREKAAEMKSLLGRYVDVVTISRPADADEQRFFRGMRDE